MVLRLGFCVRVRVRVRVSITGSGSYLIKNFVIFWRLCCHLVSVPEDHADLPLVYRQIGDLALERYIFTSGRSPIYP